MIKIKMNNLHSLAINVSRWAVASAVEPEVELELEPESEPEPELEPEPYLRSTRL